MCLSFLMWVSVMLLHKIYASESDVVIQPDPVMSVSVGDNVTLRCLMKDHVNTFVWYKQTSGQKPQFVVMAFKYGNNPVFYDMYNSSRFSIERTAGERNLKILNVVSSDEAMYYCGWTTSKIDFANGTYLALTGSQNKQHKLTVSVLQHPVSASVHPGDTVTLLCSVLSEHTTAEMKMSWFRSDSGKSLPQIIYTHDQSDQCEIVPATQSCTYNLTKNIVSQTDTGMYYCAVFTCGKLLFGNGTQINLEEPVESIVIILGVLLCICVVVIAAQAVSSYKKERYYREKVLQDIDRNQPSGQDCDTVDLHYAAPHFKQRKTSLKRVRRQDVPLDSVYSQLNNHSVVEYWIDE